MELSELLERVRGATGPDRELDDDLLEIVGIGYYDYTRSNYEYRVDEPSKLDLTKAWGHPHPTASIDAALALTDRCLPDANCKGVEYDPSSGWSAYVSRNNVQNGHWLKEAYAPTAPLAILDALLSALIAKASQ